MSLDTANGIAACFESGQICTITASDARAIGNALLASQDAITASLGVDSGVTDTIDGVVSVADTDNDGQISDQEMVDYLGTQGIMGSSCTFDSTAEEYTCI